MKAVAAGELCSECGGLFASQEALARHLLDHNRLRALDGGVPVAVPVATPVAASSSAFPAAQGRPPAVATKPTLQSGVVQYYNPEGEFGFIKRSGRSGAVHFHLSVCNVQTPAVVAGEAVQFAEKLGKKGAKATYVARKAPGSGKQHWKGASPRTPTQKSPTRDLAEVLRAKEKALAELPKVFAGGDYPRFVYVDLDNIWFSFAKAEHILSHFPCVESTRELLFDLESFTRRLGTGGPSSSVDRLVAFYFNTPEMVARALRRFSHGDAVWDVRKQETTSDTSMQLELFKEKRPCGSHPKTLVLVTGDGNIAPNGMGFRDIVDQYLRDGWYVEVHAWLSTTAQSYIEFQRQYPTQVVIRPFDGEHVAELVRVRDHAFKSTSVTSEDDEDKSESQLLDHTAISSDNDCDEVEYKADLCDEMICRTTSEDGSDFQIAASPATSENEGKSIASIESDTVEQERFDNLTFNETPEQAISYDMASSISLEGEDKQPQPESPPYQSQSERVVALARAMSAMTSGSEVAIDLPHEPQMSTAEKILRENLFETIAHLLDIGMDADVYVPSALAILGITRPNEAMALQQADMSTHRTELRASLQHELDNMRLDDTNDP